MELISTESIKAKALGKKVRKDYFIDGQMQSVNIANNGTGGSLDLSKPIGEMAGPAGIAEFTRKSVVDITSGELDNPLLYLDLYREERDPTFSESVDVFDFLGLQAAFGEVVPGENVPTAQFKPGNKETVKIKHFAFGFGIDSAWIKFNQVWKLTQAMKQTGFAWNALLNHIHFSPLLTYNYGAKEATAYVNTADLTVREKIRETLKAGLNDAMQRATVMGQKLRPTIAVCNSPTAFRIQEVVEQKLIDKGSEYAPLTQIQKIVAYDGASFNLGEKKVDYPAPADNVVYLVQPKRALVSLIKEDLQAHVGGGDLMKLIMEQRVWEAFRGVVAQPAVSVHKVSLA